jgi:hypothetical protein
MTNIADAIVELEDFLKLKLGKDESNGHMDQAKQGTMEKLILDKITRYGNVSFAELSRDIDGFNGDVALTIPSKNVILWNGISQAAYEALNALLDGHVIEMMPTSELTYLVDGTVPGFPVVKQNRCYKEPHWLPVVFNKYRQQVGGANNG